MRIGAYLRSSLAGRIFLAFIIPATAAMVLVSLVNNYATLRGLQIADDKTLRVFSGLISTNLAGRDGKILFKIPEGVFANLDGFRDDAVFYSVVHKGRVLYGTTAIVPEGSISIVRWGNEYYDGYVLAEKVRIIRVVKRIPNVDGEISVYVASNYAARPIYEWLISWIYVTNGSVFLLCLITIIWFSVRWAIRPLSGLKDEIEARSLHDDHPIALGNVPIELHSVVGAFNDLIYRLQELLNTTRRFTADASHQMRTPLSVLRTHLDVLRHEGLDGPRGQTSLDDIEAAASGLQRLLTQLLALARAEDALPGAIAELGEEVDLVAIARHVAEIHVGNALSRGIELQFDANPPQLPVFTVDLLAQEMMANLLDNAIRYNRRGGSVWFSLKQVATGVQVVIEDDGPGIPVGDTDRVLERFARLPRDRNQEGSGLGLAIVLALAKAIGVELTITSRAGDVGVRAEIIFPHK